MSKAAGATLYCIDPMSPFPKRWTDPLGPIRVMGEPIEGYLICRRPGSMPFILSVKQILNTERHPIHGPFEVVMPKVRARAQQESKDA